MEQRQSDPPVTIDRANRLRSAMSVTVATGVLAVAAAAVLFGLLQWRSATTVPEAGFWYENGALTLPAGVAARLGGPLEPQEIAVIEATSRAGLERAFSGLRITITHNHHAFWRLVVRETLASRGRSPNAGESFELAPLGGAGAVSFLVLAIDGIEHAPPGASRRQIIEGIGRGIGRAVAHELAHQILGADMHDNGTDPNSYEYFTSDRASQYYGRLHWTTAWPFLQRKLGTR